jgi:hypothetical protein
MHTLAHWSRLTSEKSQLQTTAPHHLSSLTNHAQTRSLQQTQLWIISNSHLCSKQPNKWLTQYTHSLTETDSTLNNLNFPPPLNTTYQETHTKNTLAHWSRLTSEKYQTQSTDPHHLLSDNHNAQTRSLKQTNFWVISTSHLWSTQHIMWHSQCKTSLTEGDTTLNNLKPHHCSTQTIMWKPQCTHSLTEAGSPLININHSQPLQIINQVTRTMHTFAHKTRLTSDKSQPQITTVHKLSNVTHN